MTLAGFGEGADGGNIEILVKKTVNDPDVAETLAEIASVERIATRSMAEVARCLADSMLTELASLTEAAGRWFPRSRQPERAYDFYSQAPQGYTKAADKILLRDLGRSNLQPGLSEEDFRSAIRLLLAEIPLAKNLLDATDDRTITRADAQSYFEAFAGSESTSNDLWTAFVEWMACFFEDQLMKQELAEIGLRRAVRLQ